MSIYFTKEHEWVKVEGDEYLVLTARDVLAKVKK